MDHIRPLGLTLAKQISKSNHYGVLSRPIMKYRLGDDENQSLDW